MRSRPARESSPGRTYRSFTARCSRRDLTRDDIARSISSRVKHRLAGSFAVAPHASASIFSRLSAVFVAKSAGIQAQRRRSDPQDCVRRPASMQYEKPVGGLPPRRCGRRSGRSIGTPRSCKEQTAELVRRHVGAGLQAGATASMVSPCPFDPRWRARPLYMLNRTSPSPAHLAQRRLARVAAAAKSRLETKGHAAQATTRT